MKSLAATLSFALFAVQTPGIALAGGPELTDLQLSAVYAQGGDPVQSLLVAPEDALLQMRTIMLEMRFKGIGDAFHEAGQQVMLEAERHLSRQVVIEVSFGRLGRNL